MRKAFNWIKAELKYANNDIDFVKATSVYLYVIIFASSMLVGLVIGLHN